ncbi:MAG: hypothetical protein M3276_00595 [Actinomycetota bacterium]|nr:hypothetical protein [Actinomycetota bacterium]
MTVAERIRVDHRLLNCLAAAGFDGVEKHDVDVHVKATADREDCCAAAPTPPAADWSTIAPATSGDGVQPLLDRAIGLTGNDRPGQLVGA